MTRASIRARPMIMVVRMLPAAWGLRAMPSQAAATALPWARPQPAAAMARAMWARNWPSNRLLGGGGRALGEGGHGHGEQEGGGEELLHGNTSRVRGRGVRNPVAGDRTKGVGL